MGDIRASLQVATEELESAIVASCSALSPITYGGSICSREQGFSRKLEKWDFLTSILINLIQRVCVGDEQLHLTS